MTVCSQNKPPPIRCGAAAIVIVLIVVSIAAVLSLTFVASQSTAVGIAENAERHSKARLIAEAGLNMAISEVSNNANWRSDYTNGVWVTNESYAGGAFSINGEDGEDTNDDGVVDGDSNLMDDHNDTLTLSVVGKYGGMSHKVKAVLIPQAATFQPRLLFVVRDLSPLTAQDQAKKTQLEAWGYTVTEIESVDTQANFDAGVAANDVVYISEELSSSNLGTKLTSAAIGIVSEEAYSNDEFGISSSRAGYIDTQIEIFDNSHYITAPFSIGTLTIATGSTDFQIASGTLAQGMQGARDQLFYRTALALDQDVALVLSKPVNGA